MKMSRAIIHLVLLATLVVAGLEAKTSAKRGGLFHELAGDKAYPVAPVAMVDGRIYEVVSGSLGHAVVRSGGALSLLPHEANIHLAKGERFAAGTIEVQRSRVEQAPTHPSADGLSQSFASETASAMGTRVSLVYSPSKDYEDVMLALLLYNDAGERALHFQQLGDLQAGEVASESFEMDVAYDYGSLAARFAFLFFGPEGEIATSGRRSVTPIINMMFEDFYAGVVGAYIAKRADGVVPLSLVHRYPIACEGAARSKDGSENEVYFELAVDHRGMVTSVTPLGRVERRLEEACVQSMKQWLFMPRSEDGFPVASRARVPVVLP